MHKHYILPLEPKKTLGCRNLKSPTCTKSAMGEKWAHFLFLKMMLNKRQKMANPAPQAVRNT